MKTSVFPAHWLFALLILASLSSCVTYEDLLYFRKDQPLPPLPPQEIINQLDIRIQPNDILAIIVSVPSSDPTLVAPYTVVPGGGMVGNMQGTSPFVTFLVDKQGKINYPGLGEVELSGLTTVEARDKLAGLLKAYINDPIVNVRVANFQITVSGEVLQPGVYPIPGERVTILEALGLAGDMTPYSNRESVMVIRETNGVREYGFVNMQGIEVFQSPYFYLKQNDIIYVEPNPNKVASVRDPLVSYVPLATATISFLAVMINLLAR